MGKILILWNEALLVLYLTKEVIGKNLGLGQILSNLYGWYTMLVYITPIIGGLIADKYLGSRKTILIGAILMTLGHLSLAFELMPAFYLGLLLLILGNGAFKPNISALVGQLYPEKNVSKKDSGYTIFYQGINVGAFLEHYYVVILVKLGAAIWFWFSWYFHVH